MNRRLSQIVFSKCGITATAIIFLMAAGCNPVPSSAVPSIVSKISPFVVSGLGMPDAGNYNPDEPGPHHVVILTKSGLTYTGCTSYNNNNYVCSKNGDWNKLLPNGWSPSSLNETEIIVLIGPEREVMGGSQSYIGPGGEVFYVTAYGYEVDVELREARSGQTLETLTYRGSSRRFPTSLPFNTTRWEGSRVQYAALEGWLCPFVIFNGCWEPFRMTSGSLPAFSPDGQSLAMMFGSYSLMGWQKVSDGTELGAMPGQEGTLFSEALSPDWKTLATGLMDGTLHLWQVSEGTILHTLEEPSDNFALSLAFSPDGQILASGWKDGSVQLWQVSDGGLVRTLKGHKAGVQYLAFSPDGQILASGGYGESTVKLWRLSDGTILHALRWLGDPVFCVTFSPDGQILASGSQDGRVKLWQVSDGSLLRTLKGHADLVGSVSFSPDGQTLASGSADGTVRFWRVADGSSLRTLLITDSVKYITFSPDGHILAVETGSFSRTVQLWQVH
jgi:WD40 repeat protein